MNGTESSRNTAQGDFIRGYGREWAWGGGCVELYIGDKTRGNGVSTKTYCLQNARWDCEKLAVVDTPRSSAYINCTAFSCQSEE